MSSLLEYVQFLHISLYYFLNSIVTISFDISTPLFLSVQWSSSQAACAHIIQEGLLNPSPDISEMLLEVTTTNQGTYSYIMSFPQSAIRVPDLILFNTLSPFLGYSIYFLYIDIQPSESLSQVAVFDIGRLLSKVPEISESVLFNVRESLLKDWGPEPVGALPKDTMHQLLTEVS